MKDYEKMAREIWNDGAIHRALATYTESDQSKIILDAQSRILARLTTLLRERDATTPALPQSWQEAVREAAIAIDAPKEDGVVYDSTAAIITAALSPLVETLKRPLELMVLWDKAENEDWEKYTWVHRNAMCREAFAEARAALALLGEKEEK